MGLCAIDCVLPVDQRQMSALFLLFPSVKQVKVRKRLDCQMKQKIQLLLLLLAEPLIISEV